MKNQSADSSPSGRAVVTIHVVTPRPLPKCFEPVISQPSPSRTAAVRDRVMSPPLPGSEVIVPHQSPAAARPVTSSTCARHAARAPFGGSGASQ
jgi:hypothetical protein